jgi:hypothetical protein
MTLGWIGNILILLALWQVGQKKRSGWLWSVAGNIIWCQYAIGLHMWDMLFVDGISLCLAAYNWHKWRNL